MLRRESLETLVCFAAGIMFSSEMVAAAAGKADPPAIARRPAASEEILPVEYIVRRARTSVVVVSFRGREGNREGLGTGFIVSPDGLIATNLHVIGEARPITVRTAEGQEYEVTAIHATERRVDLAVLKIDARNLPALELGDSNAVQQGQPVVAIGNPLGLEHSVVSGVVSGRREIDGMPMIQLAIPIERGNSGGPLLDRHGRVLGLLTLKSLVTENLGFAVGVNALKPLLEKPNPTPMSRWLTIGALDPREWTPLFGAEWRQRAGRITVTGAGKGFGGRSLNLSQREPPELPYEVAVTVRLKKEEGAAGLAFHADGGNRHYGFYPSNGRLRLSRFDGPDVFAWKVLDEVASPHYRPGEWNTLKVRLEKDRIRCFVNDEPVITSADLVYTAGRVGLAKFRDTEAEFRGFRVEKDIPPSQPSPELRAEIAGLVAEIETRRPPTAALIQQLAPRGSAGAIVLREQARQMERQAERLRQLAGLINRRQVQDELAGLLQQDEQHFDLLQAALLIAKLDNDELDTAAYLRVVDRMAEEILAALPKEATAADRLDALDRHLFEELGFHGSRSDYYNRSNSYLNEVIDDREGLPITLSVLYMELARRIGLHVVGVGLPGHFVVRFEPSEGAGQLIDVFDRGRRLTREEAQAKVRAVTGQDWDDSFLDETPKRQILLRMLRNLMNVAREANDPEGMLRYVETLAVLDPGSSEFLWYRAILRLQTDRLEEALQDAERLLEHPPPGIPLAQVQQLRQVIEQALGARK